MKVWSPRNQPWPSMPYNGEFHFTALRTLGTFRTMSASRRFPRSRFQPGIPAMYACTGASPSAFAMRGLPPERTTATFSPFRTLIGLASLAPGLALVPAFAVFLSLAAGLRAPLARDARSACGFALAPSSTRFILPLSADTYAMQLCKQGPVQFLRCTVKASKLGKLTVFSAPSPVLDCRVRSWRGGGLFGGGR